MQAAQWLETTDVCMYEFWLNTEGVGEEVTYMCTCPSVLSRAASHPETPQPQRWWPRRQEGGSAPTRCPASLQGTCGGHLDISQWCLLVFPLRSRGRLQSAPICRPPCGRGHPSDLLTGACWVNSLSLHLMGKASMYITTKLYNCK